MTDDWDELCEYIQQWPKTLFTITVAICASAGWGQMGMVDFEHLKRVHEEYPNYPVVVVPKPHTPPAVHVSVWPKFGTSTTAR